MSGKVGKRKNAKNFYVAWYDKKTKKTIRIYRYKGERMYHESIANKLLAVMQAGVENGTFVLERYTRKGWTDVIPFIEDWLKKSKHSLSPATYKGYKSYVKTHIKPYFKENHHLSLHDIQLDVLTHLKNQLPVDCRAFIPR